MTDIKEREITFRTEIEFKGSIEEFQQLSADLVKLPIRLRAEWPPTHTAGCWPVAPEKILDNSSQIELNGVGDNPVFFPDENLQLSGANFQGSPVSLPMDMAGAAITMVSVLSERRLNRLNNPALNVGLPSFLTKRAGIFSGLMLSQYTADMQVVEQRILSAPASIQSIPAAADQEDFVSMGMNTAIKNFQILDNAYGILGIEFMAAAQALDFRKYKFGIGVTKAKEIIRKYVKFLDKDRPLYKDHTKMKELVKSCEILNEVEKLIGKLE